MRGVGAPAERIIVALDLPGEREALALARSLSPALGRVKVGPALFALGGARLLGALQDLDLRVFLDLKLHDIPRTVRAAASTLGRLGAEFLTVHLAGGAAMVRAALEGAREAGATRILGVTVLSSLDAAACREVGLAGSPAEAAARLARLGAAAGVDGIVCSPLEAAALRPVVPPPRLIVTPGIRPRGAASDDQARTASASEAIAAGADLVVVGRPVTAAPDPAAALAALALEIGA